MPVPAHPPEHPQRRRLALEIHARPPEALVNPARASYLAVMVDSSAREQELAHLAALAAQHAVAGPGEGATHWRVQLPTRLGTATLKWERHGEFSGYTVIVGAAADSLPFAQTASAAMPAEWWRTIPGQTLAAVALELRGEVDAGPSGDSLVASAFGSRSVVGALVADASAQVMTDFWLHDDGCTHVLVIDRGLGAAQAGRIAQRLFEIEAYRVLALLALPIAQRQAPRIDAIEKSLATLTDGIAQGGGDDEALLHQLTTMAAEVESGIAASQFRFGACAAYHGLVQTRIAELREQRLPGVQTLEEFMGRRLSPAVATCTTVQSRLRHLADRVGQASALLSTRVDIARERQNQQLLASMDRRARTQLRLQQTVEGLSVAAIAYYLLGLLGYGLKGAKAAGLTLNPDLIVGVAVPVVAVALLFALRHTRRRIARRDAERDPHDDATRH